MRLVLHEVDGGKYIERIMSKFGTRLLYTGPIKSSTVPLRSLKEYYEVAGTYGKTGENREEFLRSFDFLDVEGITPETLPPDLVGFLRAGPKGEEKYIKVYDFFEMPENKVREWFSRVSGNYYASKVMDKLMGGEYLGGGMNLPVGVNDPFHDSFTMMLKDGMADLRNRTARFIKLREKAITELHALGISDSFRADL